MLAMRDGRRTRGERATRPMDGLLEGWVSQNSCTCCVGCIEFVCCICLFLFLFDLLNVKHHGHHDQDDEEDDHQCASKQKFWFPVSLSQLCFPQHLTRKLWNHNHHHKFSVFHHHHNCGLDQGFRVFFYEVNNNHLCPVGQEKVWKGSVALAVEKVPIKTKILIQFRPWSHPQSTGPGKMFIELKIHSENSWAILPNFKQ